MMNLWFAGSEVTDSHGSPAIVKPPTNFRKISVKIYSCDFLFAGDIIGAKSEGSLMHELAKYHYPNKETTTHTSHLQHVNSDKLMKTHHDNSVILFCPSSLPPLLNCQSRYSVCDSCYSIYWYKRDEWIKSSGVRSNFSEVQSMKVSAFKFLFACIILIRELHNEGDSLGFAVAADVLFHRLERYVNDKARTWT